MESVSLNPIGVVKNNVTEAVDEHWGKVISEIHLLPELADGLHGLEDWSHVVVIFLMHQTRYNPTEHLVRHPQEREDMPKVGIFAQRGRHRPNLIGITAVKVLGVDGPIFAGARA